MLDDLLVSRQHAKLHQGGGRWQIVDLGSANGRYVNGQRISQATAVDPDSMIGIGRSLLQLAGDRLVAYVDSGDAEGAARSAFVNRPGVATGSCLGLAPGVRNHRNVLIGR